MRTTSLFVTILVVSFIQLQVLCDRRVQDANADFLNVEGNRRPTPTKPNPNGATGGVKNTPTTPSSPTGTKQIIKQFNDRIAENQNQGNISPAPSNNRNTPSRQNSQGNRESFPSLPNQNQNRQTGPWQSTGTTPTTSNPPAFNNQWGPQIRNQNGNQNKEFPGLPNSATPTVQPNTPKSWSSVVSNNNKPASGTNSPPNTGPRPTDLTVRSSAGLKPIIPGAPLPPVESTTPIVEVLSDKELQTLSENLFKKDSNNAAKYVTVNYQGRTSSFSKDDLSPQPLLSIQKAAWDLPTIAAMKSLLDNYEQDTTVNEHVTAQEKNEENAFLDAVMATTVIRHLMSELKEKKLVSPDPKEQKDVLKSIWFNMYSRGQGRIGSSGFEHIFLSELKNGEISGLHNWLYFATQEDANNVNYLGYMKKLDIGDKQAILKLHFNMKGIDKPVDTMFVGTTPELEMALYSLCFLTRADRACPLSLGGKTFNLRTHTFRYRSKDMIGSAFPEI